MALLDFIKNRGGQQPAAEQQSQQQKPDNAKQMYTQKDAEDRANAKPIALSASDDARAKDANALFSKSFEPTQPSAPAATPAPTDGSTAPQEPMVQASMSQGKAAPDMSPTSAQAAGREKEQGVSVSEAPTPSPTPNAPTRNPPSWDR